MPVSNLSRICLLLSIAIADFAAAKAPRNNGATNPVGIASLSPDRPVVMAHRTCWRLAAENSVSGIRECIKHNIAMVEVDVRTSKDGELFLLHDDTLDRTTTMTGNLADYTAKELKSAKLRTGAGGPGSSVLQESVPTLAEALRATKKGAVMVIEIKAGDPQKVFDTVIREGAQDWVVFFHFADILKVPTLPDWVQRRSLMCVHESEPTCLGSVEKIRAFQPFSLITDVRDVGSMDKVASIAKELNLLVWGYAVSNRYAAGKYAEDWQDPNPQEDLQEKWRAMLKHGVSILCTDFPTQLQALIESSKPRNALSAR